MYRLLVIAQVGNPESNDPAAQRAEIWLLVLITVILVAGFFTAIWLTKKPKHRKLAPPKPPHAKNSWWNP
jgi:flagellar basal body-associated protein FliL